MTLVVKTVKSAGGDYSSLNAAIVGEQADLVTPNTQLEIHCFNFIDTTAVSFSGTSWSTSTSNFPTILAVDNHGGLFGGSGGTSAYSLQVTTGSFGVIGIFNNGAAGNWAVTGLSISVNSTGGGNGCIYSAGANVTIDRCICNPSGGSVDFGIQMDQTTEFSLTGKVSSTIVFADSGKCFFDPDVNSYRDCTAIGGASGFHPAQTGTVVKNCLASGNTTCFDTSGGGTFVATTCASSDATASGTGARINQTFTFVNSGANDYHLSASDAGAKGFGTDLSADGITLDIDSQSITAPWNIGADQFATNVTNTGKGPRRAPAFGLFGVM